MNASYHPKDLGKGPASDTSKVQTKVEQDIAFLEHRIGLMKKQKNPNPMVIEIYENMLKSRLSVLAWLRDGNNEDDLPPL